jgi:hypothetical protein
VQAFNQAEIRSWNSIERGDSWLSLDWMIAEFFFSAPA